ncbi:MAG: hypothetical protein AAB348_00035 [Patescibacteria group bacterium]
MSEKSTFQPDRQEGRIIKFPDHRPELPDVEIKAVQADLSKIGKRIFDLEEELAIFNDVLKSAGKEPAKLKWLKKLSLRLSKKERALFQARQKAEQVTSDDIKEDRKLITEQFEKLNNQYEEIKSKLGPEYAAEADKMLNEIRAMRKELGRTTLEKSFPPPEYVEALSEVFKGEELDRVVMPEPGELTDEYFAQMYPKTQKAEDKDRGLVSYRPRWWNDAANKDVVGSDKETWGQVYTRSLKAEAERFGGKIIITESIQKPNYKDGSQQYGTVEGNDAAKDPLLPIIQKVFGKKANHFNLNWDKITTKLIPNVKKSIQDAFAGKHLSVPNFEVILTPALVSNWQMTKQRPKNSQTNTSELTSTILLKQDGTDSGNRLVVGGSWSGGAGCMGGDYRGHRWGRRGFRLSVVFKND